MNATNLYTRSRMGLDNRVWLVLLITALLSLGLLAFRLGTHQPCMAIRLSASAIGHPDGDNYYPQEQLAFQADMQGLKEVVWDFGDNSPLVTGNNVTHSFAHAGNFFITATVNGTCRELLSVYIHPPVAQAPAGSAVALEDIIGPELARVGEPAVYATSINGTTYEWNVLNSPEYPTQKTPTATYTFQAPGARILELRVGDRVARKNIQVLPSDKPAQDPAVTGQPLPQQPLPQQDDVTDQPPETAKPASRSTYVADEVLKDLLDKVTEGEKDASSFAAYLCSGPQTKVRENGESWTTLGELCSKIHDKKKYKIKSVVTIRDPNDKCVLQLQVTYKKKGFLGL